jgi:deoxyribose-phosphate aldolase
LSEVGINPSLLPGEKHGLRVVACCGFPSGAHRPEVNALDAKLALAHGVDEIDMVINLGAVKAGD